MSDETAEKGRGLRIALFLSLALNLVVMGAIGGWVLRHGSDVQGLHAARLAQLGGPLTHALDAEGRRAVAQQLRNERDRQEARQKALRESFAGLLADLRAQPFDPVRVEARLAAQRTHVTGRLEAGHAALVAHLVAMGNERRAAYADRLQENLGRWRWHHGRHHR